MGFGGVVTQTKANIIQGPREITTARPALSLPIPEGMARNEFFNSAANLKNLAEESGLLRTSEDWLLFRKIVGHSAEFDACIILDSSNRILNPLGRPVRRDQLSEREKSVWVAMTNIVLEFMVEKYPDPKKHLLLCGEAALDPTWPLAKRGVPSIRMIHNHFMVFPFDQLHKAPITDRDNPNLTDSGHNTLFLKHLSGVYRNFFRQLDFKLLKPMEDEDGALALTGYPHGLPTWQIPGGMNAISNPEFWGEYERVLHGFLDFYRAFFDLVSTGKKHVPKLCHFPQMVEDFLFSERAFEQAALKIRSKVINEPAFANLIRWQPAYKQVLYRDERGRFIVAISQNSIGNAITELLGIVVNRQEDADGYAKHEAALAQKLLEVRSRMLDHGLGSALDTPNWPTGSFERP